MIVSYSVSALLLLLCTISIVRAHVLLVYPTPRTNNDYLFTFDAGVCDPDSSCAAFCGDPYDAASNPTTVLPVGVPITLRWKTNVAHAPFRYRLSLNPAAGDANFESTILTTISNADAADPSNSGRTGSFFTEVTIPKSALETCSEGGDPCVLQLWDLYYFVSCANVFLTAGEVEEQVHPPTPTPETLDPLPMPNDMTLLFQGASFEDYRVTIGYNEPQLDPILYLDSCQDYTFVIDAPGHPFVIKTQPGLGLDNVLSVDSDRYTASDSYPATEGMERGSFTFQASRSAPETGLYYQCTLHKDMVGEIRIDHSSNCTGGSSGQGEDLGTEVDGPDESNAGSTATTVSGLLLVALTGGMAMLL